MRSTIPFVAFLLALLLLDGCGKKDDPQTTESFTITPNSGSVATQVTITGAGFAATEIGNVVKFNGKNAVVILASPTVIVASVPDDAGTGPVTVEANGKTQTGPVFTYTEPKVTMAYYVSFKAAEKLKVFQTPNPFYESCGQCACATIPPLDPQNFADFNLCFDGEYSVERGDIEAFAGKTFAFGTATYPTPYFAYTEGGISFDSQYVSDQTGGAMTITKVESDGSLDGQLNIYKITGTFSCKVAQSGQSPVAITDGTFVINFSEN